MLRTAALLLAAAFAGALVLPRLAGAGLQEAERPPAQRVEVVRALAQEPYWETLTVRDETDVHLMTVPAGKRFVLTDMWLMPMEEEHAGVHPNDRLWLENRRGGKNFIVFDTYASRLEFPLRWLTGVAFPEGSEVWFQWDFDPAQRRDRRLHFTGYFEELPEPAPAR